MRGPKQRRNRRKKAPEILVKRFPVSYLSDVVYFQQPMSRELAETVRALRRDHGLSYERLAWALAETEPDLGQCFGYGRALTERASIVLDDHDPAWV